MLVDGRAHAGREPWNGMAFVQAQKFRLIYMGIMASGSMSLDEPELRQLLVRGLKYYRLFVHL